VHLLEFEGFHILDRKRAIKINGVMIVVACKYIFYFRYLNLKIGFKPDCNNFG
jgi:hypothetical protein